MIAAAKAKMIEKLEKRLEEEKKKLAAAEARAQAKAMAAAAAGPALGTFCSGAASAAAPTAPTAPVPETEVPIDALRSRFELDAWGFPIDEPPEEEMGASGAGTAGSSGPPGVFYNPWDVMTEDAPFRTEWAKAQHEAGVEVPVYSAFIPDAGGVQGGPPPTPMPSAAPATPTMPTGTVDSYACSATNATSAVDSYARSGDASASGSAVDFDEIRQGGCARWP